MNLTLGNPHTVHMLIELRPDGVHADFPALECEGVSRNPDPWRARDEAILYCAQAIVVKLQGEGV